MQGWKEKDRNDGEGGFFCHHKKCRARTQLGLPIRSEDAPDKNSSARSCAALPGPDVRPVLVFLVPICLQRLPRVAPSWPDMNHSKPPDGPHNIQQAWATNVGAKLRHSVLVLAHPLEGALRAWGCSSVVFAVRLHRASARRGLGGLRMHCHASAGKELRGSAIRLT